MARKSVALCGAGMISGAHGAAARYLNMAVVAVASRTPERAAERASQLQSTAVTYDQLPAGADIVIVSTPPQMHAADTLALLETGAAVIVEKPLCTTLADADTLVTAARAHHERVLYAENLAYAPSVTTMLRLVPKLGPLKHLQIRSLQSLPTWGDFTSDEWGGGTLFDLGVHPVALAVLCAAASGAGVVTSVSCNLRGGAGHNSDEHAELTLTFHNGLVGHVVSSWANGPHQVWDAQLSSDTGVLRLDFWPQPTLEHNGERVPLTQSSLSLPLIEQFGYYGQLQAFAADITDGATPFMEVAFGRMILDIVCAAYQSARYDGAAEAVPFTGDRTKTPLQLWHGA